MPVWLRWPAASLRTYLTAVILVATVPLALFALYLVEGQLATARAERQATLYRSANALAALATQDLAATRLSLRALLTHPALASGKPEQVRQALAGALQLHADWARLEWREGTAAPVAADASPAATGPAPTRLTEEDGGHSLTVTFAPPHWQHLLSQLSVTAETFLSLTDEQGRVLAVSHQPEHWLGKPLPVERQPQALDDRERSLWAPWFGDAFVVTRAIDGTGWRAAAGRFRPAAWTRIEPLSYLAAAGVLSLGLGLLLAHLIARRVSTPLQQLASGKPIGARRIEVHEIAMLREALSQATLERQQAMAALQAKAKDLEAVFEASPVGLVMQQAGEPLVMVNPALAALLGCRPGLQNLAQWLNDAQDRLRVLADGEPLAWDRWPQAQVLASGRPVQDVQIDLLFLDGTQRTLLAQACPVGGGPSPRRAIATFTDISERQQIEQQRQALVQREREAREVAERANRGKDEFLAMLGHELRNPLSAITAAVEVINRVGPQENAAQSARRIIGRQTQQLVGLMNDLTDIARIGAGKARLTRQRINLARLVWRTQAALRLAGRFRHHSLGLELQQAWIEVDAMRIEQVIGNLLTNATKYTPPGGHITLSLRVVDHEAEIRVADDGVGMSRTLLERVFDVFVQGERSPQSQGGLGLGLALVRRLVELHGGTVHAASAGQDLGSCFTVRLPGAESPADGATFARPLLIVAPGPEALGAVESLVEEAACDVTLVPTPDDVERCLARVNPRPALLLVDGCEVDAHTLAHWKTVSPGLRVGVLGAVDGPGEVPPIDWVETGFDTLVAHPLHLRNLLEEEASDTPA